MSKPTKREIAEREEAIKQLSALIKPGDKIYTILRRVSSSGMSRCISLFRVDGGEPAPITYLAAKAMGSKLTEIHGHHCIRVGGCGMDMGFALVYNLGRTLFPDGFIPADAGLRSRNGTPSGQRDSDGGYALIQNWL